MVLGANVARVPPSMSLHVFTNRRLFLKQTWRREEKVTSRLGIPGNICIFSSGVEQRTAMPGYTKFHNDIDADPEDASSSDALEEEDSPCVSIMKKCLSEFVGTFILLIAAAGTGIVDQKSGSLGIQGCAAGSGLPVVIIILATGHISGAHINPAVTLAFASFCHFPWGHVPFYIVSQTLGSLLASYALKILYSPAESLGVTVPANGDMQSLCFELLVTSILMFVITSVSTDTRAVGELAAIAVGATVYLNNLIARPVSGASMNPVRTLGPAVAANNYRGLWVYIVGPILGAQLGAGVYTLMRAKGPGKKNGVCKFQEI